MDGFEGALKDRLMSDDLHLMITPTQEAEGYSQGVKCPSFGIVPVE